MSKSFLRNVIGEYMAVLAEKNDKVVIVNADLAGTCRNRGFAERFPERAFNTGIAEQNLVSFSAGLACEGFLPYAFSMAPFLTMRACEQVRTDVAYGNRNVRLVGVYAGVSGGISGATHWAIEDVGIMTSIPNITVFEVCDANQARCLLEYSLIHEGPIYIRCGVEPTEDIYPETVEIKPGGSRTVREGTDGAILCTGVVVQYAIEAAEIVYQKTGRSIRVVDMYSIKPVDRASVISAATTGRLIVAQDHTIFGGLGSLVSMILAEENIQAKIRILGIPDRFVPMAHAPYLYREFGIDSYGLAEAMERLLEE